MKIKMERLPTIFNPKLTMQEREEVSKFLDEKMKGVEQTMVGTARRDLVEKFLSMMDPERTKQLESEIKTLHGMTDFNRFRTQFVLILIDVFYGGVASKQTIKSK
jgi:hypothetical protein